MAQTLQEVRQLIQEFIIVDDGSTIDQDTMYHGIEADFPDLKIKIIRHTANRGPAAARNTGISAANGQVFLFIDSDVSCTPDCVRLLYEHIENYDIAFPTILYDDNTRKNPQNHQFNKDHCMDSAMFMIKRSALHKMDSFFDEDIRIGEDFDFFVRAYIFGLRALHVKNATARHPVRKIFTADHLRADLQYPLYAILKMAGMCKYHIPWLITTAILLTTHLIGALSGRKVVLFSNIKIARYSSPRIQLLTAYLAALKWNVVRSGEILKKRKNLRSILKEDAILCKKLKPFCNK